jgi:hypothetical protein
MIRGAGWVLIASAAAMAAFYYSKKRSGLHQIEDPSDPVLPVLPVQPEETATKAEALDKTLVSAVNAWMLRQSWYRQPGELVPPRIVRVDWVAKTATLSDGTRVERGVDRIAEVRSEKGQIYYILYTADGLIKRMPS